MYVFFWGKSLFFVCFVSVIFKFYMVNFYNIVIDSFFINVILFLKFNYVKKKMKNEIIRNIVIIGEV